MKMRGTQRGFTLFEMLIVLGMFAIVVGCGLVVSMESYRGQDMRSDRDMLVALLQRARAQSMNNMCSGTCTDGVPHGVHIDDTTKKFVLYQGSAYNAADTNNASFDASQNTTHTSTDVLFTQLSGTTTGYTIHLAGDGKTSDITVSTQGQITWTN